MIEIENTAYDEDRVKKAFEEAGGCWLNFPDGSYLTYDASHLTTESSKKFSSDLAYKILDCLHYRDNILCDDFWDERVQKGRSAHKNR